MYFCDKITFKNSLMKENEGKSMGKIDLTKPDTAQFPFNSMQRRICFAATCPKKK